jgi:hypothetical protein
MNRDRYGCLAGAHLCAGDCNTYAGRDGVRPGQAPTAAQYPRYRPAMSVGELASV